MQHLFDTVVPVDPRDLKRKPTKQHTGGVGSLKKLIRELTPVEYMTDEELANTPFGSTFVFDVECYRNLFYIAFKCVVTGKVVDFELSERSSINQEKLRWMLRRYCLVSFNGIKYDMLIISLFLAGATCQDLKEASDSIIKEGLNVQAFETKYKIKSEPVNHVDLIEVAPLNGSLKLYGGRLHCSRMQDLPIDPDAWLSQEDCNLIKNYCCNDLANTELLLRELYPEIKLRSEMSNTYGIDLRSKSDAQLAEAVICNELSKVIGRYPSKANLEVGVRLQYIKPAFIQYRSEALNKALWTVMNARFSLDGNGSPIMPDEIKDLSIKIGNGVYTLGMGGLHSTEAKISHVATDEIIIADNDVESYYPRIILNQKLYPKHLGPSFLTVFEYIVNKRIDAKGKAKALKACDKIAAAGFKVVADSLKITINGSFGKFGNEFSRMYAPDLLLQVTISGQLSLLMLIEALEDAGIEVISANTDGIVSKYHKSRHDDVRAIIAAWETVTGYKTEESRYKAVYSRDVNSYIAVKMEGGDPEARFLDERLGCKTKGAFSERGSALNSVLSRNPENLICIDAVLQFIVNGVSVEHTIKSCKDIRRFVSIKNVKGGGQKDGVYLGKVVRWYYAVGERGYIACVQSGNKVANTDNAKPLMDLPQEFPSDVDFDWYIEKAVELLFDCGYYTKQVSDKLSLF